MVKGDAPAEFCATANCLRPKGRLCCWISKPEDIANLKRPFIRWEIMFCIPLQCALACNSYSDGSCSGRTVYESRCESSNGLDVPRECAADVAMQCWSCWSYRTQSVAANRRANKDYKLRTETIQEHVMASTVIRNVLSPEHELLTSTGSANPILMTTKIFTMNFCFHHASSLKVNVRLNMTRAVVSGRNLCLGRGGEGRGRHGWVEVFGLCSSRGRKSTNSIPNSSVY